MLAGTRRLGVFALHGLLLRTGLKGVRADAYGSKVFLRQHCHDCLLGHAGTCCKALH
jgi:hypothetical protein